MKMQQLELIQKQCNLTDIELGRFNQIIINGDRNGSQTAKEIKIPCDKCERLVACGYLKKVGICVQNGSLVREKLFELA